MGVSISIEPFREDKYKRVFDFQCEYLDRESYEQFVKRVEAHPELYLTAFDGEELVGICYGHPSTKTSGAVNLQGIAVSLDESLGYARQGHGSVLLRAFEIKVLQTGWNRIEVGSADDEKVERFYVKNGFVPFELVAKDAQYEELERVPVSDYASGKARQAELRAKHRPQEVIFIFAKTVRV